MSRFGIGAAAALCLMVAAVALASPTANQSWFDLENCSACKNMVAEPGLMEHMQWENHLIATGCLSVTVVEPDYAEAFARSQKNMGEVFAKVMQGEDMPLCGLCSSMRELHAMGASMESMETATGHVTLITATDEAAITKIHAHAQRTLDEFAKMKAAHPEEGGDHAGHDH